MESKSIIGTKNYHQSQVLGEEQTIITDQHITAETDELDPAFFQQTTPRDPEDEDDEQEDDDFPEKEELEDDDFDLDQDDDFDLDEDDEEFK